MSTLLDFATEARPTGRPIRSRGSARFPAPPADVLTKRATAAVAEVLELEARYLAARAAAYEAEKSLPNLLKADAEAAKDAARAGSTVPMGKAIEVEKSFPKLQATRDALAAALAEATAEAESIVADEAQDCAKVADAVLDAALAAALEAQAVANEKIGVVVRAVEGRNYVRAVAAGMMPRPAGKIASGLAVNPREKSGRRHLVTELGAEIEATLANMIESRS
jgi:hypothetical protein